MVQPDKSFSLIEEIISPVNGDTIKATTVNSNNPDSTVKSYYVNGYNTSGGAITSYKWSAPDQGGTSLNESLSFFLTVSGKTVMNTVDVTLSNLNEPDKIQQVEQDTAMSTPATPVAPAKPTSTTPSTNTVSEKISKLTDVQHHWG